MTKAWVSGIVLLAAMGAAHAQVNLLHNGSFEDKAIGGLSDLHGYLTISPAFNPMAAWTIVSGNVDVITTFWTAQDGAQSLDLTGMVNGTIAQSFATTAGQRYDVSFWVAGRPNDGTKTALASVGGVSQAISFNTSGHSYTHLGWTQQSFSFVGDGGIDTLSFASTQAGGSTGGVALDNVTVMAAVPEPASYAMLLAGLGLMGLVALRRKNGNG